MMAAAVDGYLFIIEGASLQPIAASPQQLNCVAISEDKSVIATGGLEQKLFIFNRQANGSYAASHTVSLGIEIKSVAISNLRIFATGASSSMVVYDLITLAEIQVINTALTTINKVSVDGTGETISLISSHSLLTYKYKHNDSAFVFLETVFAGLPGLRDVSISANGARMMVTVLGSQVEVYVGCNVPHCF